MKGGGGGLRNSLLTSTGRLGWDSAADAHVYMIKTSAAQPTSGGKDRRKFKW